LINRSRTAGEVRLVGLTAWLLFGQTVSSASARTVEHGLVGIARDASLEACGDGVWRRCGL
jgi:hypothetical protein